MKREILSEAVKLNIARRRKKRWQKAVSAMAALVVFVTTYALILPAITMERETVCGLPEHSHDQACWFSPTIDLGKTLDCGFANHVHMAECFGTDGELICGQADYVAHYHDLNCFDADGTLVCTLENRPEHSHSDECYEVHDTYVCGLQEGEGSHAHTGDCYSIGELVCTLEECEGHSHGDGCFDGEDLVCKLEETQGHTHGGDCFGTGELVCTMEENPGHEHSELCAGEPERELICTLKETVLHTHTQQCFDTEGNLICTILQVLAHQHGEDCFVYHEHGDECYGQSESGDVLICRYHVHDEGCLDDNGDYICSQPVLICGMEEHSHTQECYPLPDDTLEVSFAVPEEYLAFIQSDTDFPAVYVYEEGSTIANNGGAPPVMVTDTENYLPQYCWVDQYGLLADENAPIGWGREFTLRLYPVNAADTAEVLELDFILEDELVFSGKVNHGAEFSKLQMLPVLTAAIEKQETERYRFAGWTLNAEALDEDFAVTEDSQFCAQFDEYLLLRLHDIGPDGTEQGEGAIEVYLPRGQSLAELDAVLFDGTPAAGCLWYDAEGQLIDTAAGFDSDADIYIHIPLPSR